MKIGIGVSGCTNLEHITIRIITGQYQVHHFLASDFNRAAMMCNELLVAGVAYLIILYYYPLPQKKKLPFKMITRGVAKHK
jgi:phosphoribosylaminoimidazole (AIR) synthetase